MAFGFDVSPQDFLRPLCEISGAATGQHVQLWKKKCCPALQHSSCNVFLIQFSVLWEIYLTYLLTLVYHINPARTCAHFLHCFKTGTQVPFRCNFICPTQYSVSHETLKCSQVTTVLFPWGQHCIQTSTLLAAADYYNNNCPKLDGNQQFVEAHLMLISICLELPVII